MGWFTGINGTGNMFNSTTIVNSDLNIYAYWVTTGNISGSVTDGAAPVGGVTVKVSAYGEEYYATTELNGSFTISGVPSGSGYTVIASKDGYNSNSIENVNVTAGANTSNIKLTITKAVEGFAAGTGTV
jgi:hypothetical protein